MCKVPVLMGMLDDLLRRGGVGTPPPPLPVEARESAPGIAPPTAAERSAAMQPLWNERARIGREMEAIDAGSDFGADAERRYGRLENDRDILDVDIRTTHPPGITDSGNFEYGDFRRHLDERAGGEGAFDRLSPAEQRGLIQSERGDYEQARAQEAARRWGLAATAGRPYAAAIAEAMMIGVGSIAGGGRGRPAGGGGGGGGACCGSGGGGSAPAATPRAAPSPGRSNPNEVLTRQVTSGESVDRLARKAAESEQKLGVHGVSMSAAPDPNRQHGRAPRGEIEQHFRVHDTPTYRDPLHRTVELPKPVTRDVARTFNRLMRRE